jgi:FdhD protein
MEEASKKLEFLLWKHDKCEQIDSGVIVEGPVSLTVNGEVWMSFMCTPVDLEALAIGFLYNERIIQSMQEVASVRVCTTGDNVDVWLHRSVENPKTWRRTSGCTGGVTATDPSETGSDRQDNGSSVLNGFRLPAQSVKRLALDLLDSQQLYKDVGGVHTSVLSDGDNVILSAEDIGRHNTLDKIAGLYLLKELRLQNPILITTGRISSEMMQKATRIGATVVISRTSPSSLSIELAQRWGVTLIGYARRDRFNIYTWPERIETGSDCRETAFELESETQV